MGGGYDQARNTVAPTPVQSEVKVSNTQFRIDMNSLNLYPSCNIG